MNDMRMYISIDPQIRFGKPCINGTRITVGDILQWLSSGMTEQEIIDDYPELQKIHIRAALAFAEEETVDFVNSFYQYSKEILNTYYISCDFVMSQIGNEYLENIEEIKKTYGMLEKDTFNIFEPLENYHREAFHDIVLMQILDPKTKEIGNIEYLRIFCKLLSEKTDYIFDNNVIVEKPKDRRDISKIDILIHDRDKKKAIIIENKINNAPNMPNQLARYYKYVTEILNEEILAIAYILPINKNKSVELEKYDKEYAEQTKELNKLIVQIPIISTKKDKDLCHGFLDKCSCISNNEKVRIYIQQYSELLKLKGENKMIIDVQKEMLKKLYADEESVKKMNSVAEIWENRWEILAAIIRDELNQKGFEPSEEDGEDLFTKNINDYIDIVFTTYVKEDDWGIGFWYNKMTPKKIQSSLQNLIGNFEDKNKLLNNEVEKNEWFIRKRFVFKIDKPINDIVEIVLQLYEELEKKARTELNKN